MGDKSKIEWTEATWNPVVGCAKVSEGCRNCYAMKVAHRLAGMGQKRYKGLTVKRSSGVEWNGTVRTVPAALDIPLRWTRPRRIFVNSMSDLFHPDVPFQFIEGVFMTMKQAPQHTFQILTKRPERMLEYLTAYPTAFGDPFEPLPNVWLGVSVEDQKSADERIPLLLQVPAAVRWLSMEPLLGPVDLDKYLPIMERSTGNEINWVVVGGESGHKARPMYPGWVKSLREQCSAAGVPFFFKQWGNWHPVKDVEFESYVAGVSMDDGFSHGTGENGETYYDHSNGKDARVHWWDDDLFSIYLKDKKESGRILDGRTWDEMPEVKP